MTTPQDFLIVVGASSGGVDALLRLAPQLAPDFPAPILVVQHIGAHPSSLPELMMRRGPNRAKFGEDGESFTRGTIYFAPPDHHMLVEQGRIRITKGPKEQHTRPAIDPLFRSAALAMGSRVIGVILSGTLDDGTAGLQAVKRCGGLAIVQDPAEASEPSMPRSALRHLDVDHTVTIDQLAGMLLTLVQSSQRVRVQEQPEALRVEHAASLGRTSMEDLHGIGSPSTYTCPDCGGVLFELAGSKPVRFLCHTGHAYSLRALAATHAQTVDAALWSSLRALQEKQAVLRALARLQSEHEPGSEARTVRDLQELGTAISVLRRYVEKIPGGDEGPP